LDVATDRDAAPHDSAPCWRGSGDNVGAAEQGRQDARDGALPLRFGPTTRRIFCCLVSDTRQYPNHYCKVATASGSSGQSEPRNRSHSVGSGALQSKPKSRATSEKKAGTTGGSAPPLGFSASM
jgi:hypothetical protein